MSNHRQATDPGPSLISIFAMAAITLAVIFYSVWIAWGATDERHWMGAGLGFLLAVTTASQTIVRASERATALEKREVHRRRGPAVQTPEEAVVARWPEPIEQANPAWVDPEETRRLTLPLPPSEAALTRLRMPVSGWRSEQERQAWLAEQDATIISNPPNWQS